jgi:hypothetical protein
MERGPPDAFCYLGPGPTDGRRLGPAPGFGFALETTSDQIDSAMPQKTHTGRPVLFFAVAENSGEEGIVANSPLTRKESPGLPAGRADSFPVQGELCRHATSVAPFVAVAPAGFQLVALAISMALPKDGPGFSQKPFIQPLFFRGCGPLPELRAAAFGLAGAGAFGATAHSATLK